MVFYRTYRPQKISELDSQSVRESLFALFAKGFDVPHAFLFSGPKGLGKTSAARIVAKVINCEKHAKIKKTKLTESEIEPDSKCFQCTSITSGANFDVLEIDGASNRGIDEIRDLKEKINLLPNKASKKIYIIDEVHMLTTEAFNALLKTLEEPPNHAAFILCTTEFHKVPQTIVSRCFRVDFKKATDDEIARSLSRIIKAEGIKVEKDAVLEIARMSDGSFRDGTKLLEEVSICSGKKNITRQYFEEKFNTLGVNSAAVQFIDALMERNAKKGLEIISKISKQGVDFKFFIEKLLNSFHLMLLQKLGAIDSKSENSFEVSEIKKLLELLSIAHSETKFAVLAQLPLELMLVEWSEKDTIGSQSDEQTSRGPAGRFPPASAHSNISSEKSFLRAVGSPSTSVTPRKAPDFYESFINEVKLHNHLIAGVLRSCEIENTNGKLTIVAISKFHKEKLEDGKTLELLEKVAKNILGGSVKIEISLRG